jgi:hypothetical protein
MRAKGSLVGKKTLTVRSAWTSQERRKSALNTTKIRDLGNIMEGVSSDTDSRTRVFAHNKNKRK